MKIVFLDIDGVLNSDRSFVAMAGKDLGREGDGYITRITVTTIDPIAVGILNKILQQCDAHFVLSSSHRMNFDRGNDEVAIPEMKEYLARLGIDVSRCLGRTPILHTSRGSEIAIWLENNKFNYFVDSFVILDDHADMLPEQHENFVRTDSRVGLTAENYREACRILGSPDDQPVFL